MKLKNVFWGLFFIAAGCLIIVNQLGYTDFSLLKLVFTIMLLPIIFASIPRLNFGGILIPVAILGVIFAPELGIENITPWPLLITSLLITIGLTIIFHKYQKWDHIVHHFNTQENFKEVINDSDTADIEVRTNFNSCIKYVNSTDFKKAYLSSNFGSLKVYFDNATLSEKGAEIYLEASFSGVELYIPKNWNIVNNINVTLSGIDEKNHPSEPKGPKVYLSGNIHFSGVEIIYI